MSWQVIRIDAESGVLTLDCQGLDWDSFPTLAKELVKAWELELLNREWGADRHRWLLEFEGSQLRLEYEHYCGCWLTAVHPADRDVVLWLGRQYQG